MSLLKDLADHDWLTLAVPSSAASSRNEEEARSQKHRCMMATDNKKAKVVDTPTSKEESCCGGSSSSNMYNRPYKKLPGTATERGWLEAMIQMGVSCGEFYLSRRATRSDCDPNQHRFQLTKADIDKSPKSMSKLAEAAKDAGVPVKVLDRDGRKYDMIFKYLATSDTYRFMGSGYTEFLHKTKLAPCQIIDIWGLPMESAGEKWLAFVISDESVVEVVGDGEGEEGGKHGRKLPLLKRWNVQL